jgi:SAM-dependent methyltransferase
VAGGKLLESRLSYCPGCDFGYFHPTPSRQFLKDFYRAGGGVDDGVPDASRLRTLDGANFQAESIQVLSMMQLADIDLASKRGGCALEIGPGYACYARIFQTLGMQYWANEPGKGSAAFLARNFGACILDTDLEQISSESDCSFDLIFSKDSFEHHPDPLASLARCCRLLRPGGITVSLLLTA